MAQSALQAESSGAALYDSGGGKPVLLLLHGIGGTWHIWKPVLALLGTSFRVVAVTLPGHHGGPRYAGSGDATVGGIADQLIADLRARGIERAHVAGNSLGGWLAIELARRGFARCVIALSPAGGWTNDADYRAVARPFRIVFALMPLILFLSSLFLGFAAVRRALGKTSMEHAERMSAGEFRDSLRAMIRTEVFPQLLRTMGPEGGVAPMTAPVPVRIAWSSRDQVIPFERYGRPLLARITGSKAGVIRGAGHVPMYDEPRQVAAQILEVAEGVEAATAASAAPSTGMAA